MTTRTYWLNLFTHKTWQEFLSAGGTVSGFRQQRWATVRQIRPGDYLLCYLTGISRWIGVYEVVSEPFQDHSPMWEDEAFPNRVRVKPIATLTPDTAVPILDMRDQLSIFQNLKSPFAWTGRVRGSPSRWKAADGEAVVRAVLEAQRNPVSRPVDPRKLDRRPRVLGTRVGPIIVPARDEATEQAAAAVPTETAKEATQHGEIQWLLLKLGNDMGLDVWVARNDRGREFDGHRFADLPRLKKELPRQYDERVNRTIELIDVLWLRGNAILAAFEVEVTTSIYSGLLRMSDLISMQPNLNIALYLVAPEERRDKVFTEVNRPTFSRLAPPLNQMCRFISFSTLRRRSREAETLISYLKPEFIEGLSESLVEEA